MAWGKSEGAVPIVRDGGINLGAWSPKPGETIDLAGTWTFAPNSFALTPSETGLIPASVPESWTDYRINGARLGSYGYGTFYLHITRAPSAQPRPILGLDIRELYTAGRVFVNGRPIAQSGVPAAKVEDETARPMRLIVPLPDSDEIDIAIQVSNHLHHFGGIYLMPRIGLFDDLEDESSVYHQVNIFVTGALTMLSLFFLIFYLVGRQDESSLLFGLGNVLATIRILTGTRLIYELVPDFPHRITMFGEYVGFYWLVAASLSFWHRGFPDESLKFVWLITWPLAIVMTLVGLFLPIYWLTYFRDVMPFYAAIATLYGLSIVGLAVWRRREGALVIFTATGIAGAFFAHDIMVNMRLISGSELSAYAYAFFAVGNAVLLGQRSQAAFVRAENLALQLTGLNQTLEAQVHERTAHLELEIERRTAAEIESARASAAKSEFLATISHEIRTPLNGVIGLSRILDEMQQDSGARRYSRALVNTGDLLLAVVSDILDFSKIEAGHLSIEPISVDIRALLEDVRDLFQPLSQAKGLSLSLTWDERLPDHILIDGNRLRQILANLLNNAIKFTEEGRIDVRVTLARDQKTADHFLITVSDTGIGIPQHSLTSLFDPFTQVRSSLADGQRGTGLGLSIASRLAHLMGGDIRVESTAGKGSIFFVNLPLVSAPAPVLSEQSTRVQKCLRVLIADDGEVNRIVLGEFVKTLGHTAQIVDNGQDALNLISQEDFDVILLDIAMPGLDGFEVTRGIRALPPPRNATHIVAVTATTHDEFRLKCISVGMDGFLAKPIRKESLENIFDAAIERWAVESGAADSTDPVRRLN
jgi:signal transduction histidine kinase/CheY-like chemotaxis protein